VPSPGEIATAVLLALPLFLASTVFFDIVHWILHRMLRSRWSLVRAMAWPHSVHHVWLDDTLQIRRENQLANVWCHLVPEYLNQLAFSALLLLVFRPHVVVAVVVLQTVVFALLLRERGLDLNHRPIAMLDAYRPLFFCPPAYHALHHVFPDAHFSAYVKLVDYIVGSGTFLRGRRFVLQAGDDAFGQALRAGLEAEQAGQIGDLVGHDATTLARTDVLVICKPTSHEQALVEAYVRATRTHQLPPEVWSVHDRPESRLARHYYGDVRLIYRTLVVPQSGSLGDRNAARAARVTLFFIRRGFNYVPTTLAPAVIRGFWRFRRTTPERPTGVARARHRGDLLAAA